MTSPEFEIPESGAPPRPPIWGWVLVLGLLSYFIATNLVSYLDRPTEDRLSVELRQVDLTLRQTVLLRQLQRATPQAAAAPAQTEPAKTDAPVSAAPTGPSAQSELLRGLDDDVSLLAQQREKSAEATFYYAVLRHEQGYTLEAEDVARLAASREVRHQAAARVYGANPPTSEVVGQLESELGTETFAARLAAVHAKERAGVENAREGLVSWRAMVGMLVLGGALLVALVLGPVLLLLYGVMRANGRWKPLGLPSGMLSDPDAERYALRAAQYVLVWLASQLVFGALLLRYVGPIGTAVMSGIGTIVGVLLLTRLPVRGLQMGFERIGLSTRNFGQHVLWGIGGVLANVPLLLILVLVSTPLTRGLPPAEHPIQDEIMRLSSLSGIAALFFLAAIQAPIWEEIAFRGALLPALVSRMRNVFGGILLSSFLFAAIHPTGVPAWPMLTMVGAMCAMLTYQTRSLWPAIIMHALHNGSILILSLLLL